jgi:hypothetical protein
MKRPGFPLKTRPRISYKRGNEIKGLSRVRRGIEALAQTLDCRGLLSPPSYFSSLARRSNGVGASPNACFQTGVKYISVGLAVAGSRAQKKNRSPCSGWCISCNACSVQRLSVAAISLVAAKTAIESAQGIEARNTAFKQQLFRDQLQREQQLQDAMNRAKKITQGISLKDLPGLMKNIPQGYSANISGKLGDGETITNPSFSIGPAKAATGGKYSKFLQANGFTPEEIEKLNIEE